MNKRLLGINFKPVRYYSSLIKNDPEKIDLTVGEGHFASPFNAKLKAFEALLKDNTKYTLVEGNSALREKIIEIYYPMYDKDKEIIITNGSTHGIFLVLSSLINSINDEIIIIGPYYPAYYNTIYLLGGKVKIIDTDKTNFKLTVEKLKEVVSNSTIALIINEPSNPTGVIYTKEEKNILLEYLKKQHFYVIVDEIYRAYAEDGFISFSSIIDEEIKKRFIFINSLSKSHMMTGYRIGFVLSNKSINNELKKLNYLSVSSIATIMQEAALGALSEETFAPFVKKYYQENLQLVHDSLNYLQVKYVPTNSGYYVFMDTSSFFMTGDEFCRYFCENYKIALVPGHIFGENYRYYVRISCCRDTKDLMYFIDKMTNFVDKNHKKRKYHL